MAELLTQLLSEGGLALCAPVYAELLAHPRVSEGFVAAFLASTRITVDYGLGEEVWLAAGNAYAAYAQRRRRSRADAPKRLLIDFVVGAHASLRADQLLTLDASRYRHSFPQLRLVTERGAEAG